MSILHKHGERRADIRAAGWGSDLKSVRKCLQWTTSGTFFTLEGFIFMYLFECDMFRWNTDVWAALKHLRWRWWPGLLHLPTTPLSHLLTAPATVWWGSAEGCSDDMFTMFVPTLKYMKMEVNKPSVFSSRRDFSHNPRSPVLIISLRLLNGDANKATLKST